MSLVHLQGPNSYKRIWGTTGGGMLWSPWFLPGAISGVCAQRRSPLAEPPLLVRAVQGNPDFLLQAPNAAAEVRYLESKQASQLYVLKLLLSSSASGMASFILEARQTEVPPRLYHLTCSSLSLGQTQHGWAASEVLVSCTCLLLSNYGRHFLNMILGSSTDVLLGFYLNMNSSLKTVSTPRQKWKMDSLNHALKVFSDLSFNLTGCPTE